MTLKYFKVDQNESAECSIEQKWPWCALQRIGGAGLMARLGRRAEVVRLMCLARAQLAEVDEVFLAGRAEISSSLVALIQNQLSHSDALLAGIFLGEKNCGAGRSGRCPQP